MTNWVNRSWSDPNHTHTTREHMNTSHETWLTGSLVTSDPTTPQLCPLVSLSMSNCSCLHISAVSKHHLRNRHRPQKNSQPLASAPHSAANGLNSFFAIFQHRAIGKETKQTRSQWRLLNDCQCLEWIT